MFWSRDRSNFQTWFLSFSDNGSPSKEGHTPRSFFLLYLIIFSRHFFRVALNLTRLLQHVIMLTVNVQNEYFKSEWESDNFIFKNLQEGSKN